MSTTTKEPNEGLRRHKLMPLEVRRTMPALGEQDSLGEDAIAHVKFFSPFGRGTWYFTEFDGEDTLFGYCVSPLGPDCDEWGYSSLNEIAEATVFGSVPAIERDCYWRTRTVREAIKSNGTD